MGFYTKAELDEIGFKDLGSNVLISKKASLYNPQFISIGDNTRIDDFCVISAGEQGIRFGRNVHIACFCSLIGKEKIHLADFSGLSSRVSLYSSSDDYMGGSMTNPTVPGEFTNVKSRPVTIGRHAIIGAGSIVLPGAYLEDGVAVGALSLIKSRCDEWSVYAGNPLIKISKRRKGCLQKEMAYLQPDKTIQE